MFQKIRRPAVAGQFYPADKKELESEIEKYLSAAPRTKIDGDVAAIMVPHAGYEFSGPIAACGYELLRGRKTDTVIILGNAHTAYFEGIAVDGRDAWETPLGRVEINRNLARAMVKSEIAGYGDEIHANEHSLEVQLPFLQRVLADDFKIVPILFGAPSRGREKLAAFLTERLNENDLVVASTDMSHYPPYEYANAVDNETLEKIKSADIENLEKHIYPKHRRKGHTERTNFIVRN